MSPSLDWMERAACVGHPDPDIFFPSVTGMAGRRQAERAALVCAECPVLRECTEHRRHTGATSGVWGGEYGLTRQIVKGRKPINHGTDAGYKAHLKRGQIPCEECRAAHKYMMREWAANHPRVRTPKQLATQKSRRYPKASA